MSFKTSFKNLIRDRELLSSKVKKYFAITYVIFLIVGFFFIRDVIFNHEVPVSKKESKKTEVEVKFVSNKIIVQSENGVLLSTYTTSKKNKRKNTDTLLDLLNYLREEEGLFYEKTAYVYGMALENVNNVSIPSHFIWKVFHNDKDITFDIHNIHLQNNAEYIIKPVEVV